ncbi:MAG: tetratricopeptide repeat protein [Candidatus Promineifilaceae bacterium]|nr:tetratricopeptide repeat protein [Candidatus Promineifilaceae bacterium]
MATLSLAFLGVVDVLYDGRSLLPFRSTKVLALLSYLAVEATAGDLQGREKRVRRERLMTLLWPDMPESSARQNLRQSSYLLRQAIPEVRGSGGGTVPFLLSDRQTVQINPDAEFTLDVAHFIQLLHRGGLEELEAAVERYCGPFLADFYLEDSNQFEAWAEAWRVDLQQMAARALATLAEQYEAAQAVSELERVAARWKTLDPLAEGPQRALMIARALRGQRVRALAGYQEYVALLEEELGVEPSPQLDALHQEIRSGKLVPEQAPGGVAFAEPGDEARVAPPTPAQLLGRTPTTPLVGREAELERLADYLTGSAQRLITVAGPGGAGKTRLASEAGGRVASHFENGVIFVPLEAVDDEEQLASAIGSALGIPFHGAEPLFRQLGHALQQKEQLLILDNFEQLLGAAPRLLDLLQAAPRLKLLVTSQERLGLPGEWLVTIGGLGLPESVEAADDSPAVELFVSCARRVRPNFVLTKGNREAVVKICRLVHGVPLGIEMAATWVRVLSCAAIAAELERNLDFTRGTMRGVPERHRSLRAVFDYMWQRLEAEERALVQQLAIFRGGFTAEAAAEVADAGLYALAELVDRSLLHTVRDGTFGRRVRYEMHRYLRLFALEKLRQREAAPALTRRHAGYYASFVAEQGRRLRGPELRQGLAALTADIDNVRAAWRVAAGAEGDALLQTEGLQTDLLEKMIEPLLFYYELQGWFHEGYEEFALPALREGEPETAPENVRRLIAYARVGEGWFAVRRADHRLALSRLEESLPLLRSLSDKRIEAFVLSAQALVYIYHGYYDEAKKRGEASLALCADVADPLFRGFSLHNLGSTAREQSDFATARERYQEALDVFRRGGVDYGVAFTLLSLGRTYMVLGALHKARDAYREGLKRCRRVGYAYGLSVALRNLGEVVAALGDTEEGVRLCKESLSLAHSLGDREGVAWAKLLLAKVRAGADDTEEVKRLFRESYERFRQFGYRYGMALAAAYLARAYAEAGENAVATRYAEKSEVHFRQLGNRWGEAFAQATLGEVALARMEPAGAADHYASALEQATAIGAPSLVLDALFGSARTLLAQDDRRQAAAAARAVAAHPSASAALQRRARLLALRAEPAQPAELPRADDQPLEETVASVLTALRDGEDAKAGEKSEGA